MFFLIYILATFFAINMGGASFAAAFAASYGGNILPKARAGLLFIVFVILGALIFGDSVATTLGKSIVPSHLLGTKALVIIFFSAGLSMFVANLTKIPQSTSLVTVAAIAGVGARFSAVNLATLGFLIPFWIVLPLISFALSYYLGGFIYPPRKSNFWLYERFINHQSKLRKFVIFCSCYSAFSVGTNNVANVVGPLFGRLDISLINVFFIYAIIYGLGAFIFTGPIKTAGNKIVPLGLPTASIISLVSGTLMIIASCFGVPQSLVMLQMGAIFAISSLKDGVAETFKNKYIIRTFYTWTINPILTFFLSWVLAIWFIK